MSKWTYPDFTDTRCQPFDLPGGDHAVLLIHGFTGTPGHMRPLGDALHAAGYTVRGILLPGHGQTLDDMQRSGWEAWLASAEDALHDLQTRYSHITVGGLSMGGLIALRLAELYPLDALLCFAPALRFKNWYESFAPVFKWLVRELPWGPKTTQHADADFDADYDIGYPGLPVSKVHDMMRLIRLTRPNLHQINCPTLVVQSRHDESVHPDVPDQIISTIQSTVKEILWLDRSPHVCTLGADRHEMFIHCINFLHQHAALPSNISNY